MPSFYERVRNVFRDELVPAQGQQRALPSAPFRELSTEETKLADKQMYDRMGEAKWVLEPERSATQAKMDESFRRGAGTVVTQVAGYIQQTQEELRAVWANNLADPHVTDSRILTEIDYRHMAVIAEQNSLASFLRDYSQEAGLTPDILPEAVNVDNERTLAHKDAAYQQEAEWVMEMEPDNHIGNDFRDELEVPVPHRTGQKVEEEKRLLVDEGFLVGANEMARRFSESLAGQQEDIFDSWRAELRVNPDKHNEIDARFSAVLEAQNDLASRLHHWSNITEIGVESPPRVVDIPLAIRAVHSEMEPDNHIGNEPVYSMEILLGERWTRDLLRSPEESEAIRDHYLEAAAEHNSEPPEYGVDPDGPALPSTVDFDRMEREVLADVKSEIAAISVGLSGADYENFTAKYEHLFSPDWNSEEEREGIYLDPDPGDPDELGRQAERDYLEKYEAHSEAEVQPVQPSRDMEMASYSEEVSANRYEYLDVAIQQLSRASSAATAREVSQPWTIPQPQQSVFIQPERAQQLAAETPEIQRDFGISL